MKALLLVVILATAAFGARVQKNNVKNIVEDLEKTQYGRTLLHMVQLHSMAQGAVQELEDAIVELIEDLNEELEDLEFDFQQRTAEHNSEVIKTEQDIQDAEIDIARAEDTVQNLLTPRQKQIQNRISQVTENAEENRQTLAENTLVREQDHEAYELQVEELNGAAAAVDEALQLLETLSNPSLAQVRKFQNTLKKIESKITKRGQFTPMIKALVSLASNQNFADQDSLRQIVDALNEFRSAVVDSVNDLTLREQEDQEEFEERVNQLDAEYADFQRTINDLSYDLSAVSDKIEDTVNFSNTRAVDLKTFEAQLDLENENYAEETEIFTDLKNEYLRELAVTEQGLALIQSVDFSGINV